MKLVLCVPAVCLRNHLFILHFPSRTFGSTDQFQPDLKKSQKPEKLLSFSKLYESHPVSTERHSSEQYHKKDCLLGEETKQ